MVKIKGLDRMLREHPFFEGMGADVQGIVAGCASNARYEADQIIHHEGDKADRFYLVRSGVVSIEMHVPGRKPVIMDTVHDGEVFGWSWITPPYRNSYDARAVQLTRLVVLDAKCLRKKMKKDCALGYELLRRFIPVMAHRLASSRLQMLDVYGSPKRGD